MKYSKVFLSIVASLLVLISVIGGTAAYLTGMFGLNNTFNQGIVAPSVVETFDGTVKTDVYVQNNGNVPIYVRCRVTIYRELADQSISEHPPIPGDDYTITYPVTIGTDWILIDDVYYYKYPIQAGEKTSNLIDRCELNQKGTVVDISTQAIQVNPAKAVAEVWKAVEVNSDGSLRPVAASAVP